jgi:glycosyltransferase involved in cell wall biosynthesis
MTDVKLVPCPRVSVVMPAYNAARFLRKALDSILVQTFKDFELIVVDDGSTDASAEILAACTDARVQVIRKTRNEGLVAALNLGIAQARGEYLARMDADDIALPNRLASQVEWLDKHPEIEVLGTAAIRIDPDGCPIERMVSVSSPNDVANRLRYGIVSLVHSSVLARTAFLRRLRGYRAEFPYAEDVDLWLRAIQYGQISILREPLMLYRANPAGIRLSQIVVSAHSHAYAFDCYRRRLRGENELTRYEFMVSIDLKPIEAARYWATALEMIMLGEVPVALALISEVLKRDSNCAKAVRLKKMLSQSPFSAQVTVTGYRLYRRLRGWLIGSPLGPFASKLKMRAIVKE